MMIRVLFYFVCTYILLELFGASVGTDKDDFESALGLLGGVVKVDEDGSESLARRAPGRREIQGDDARLVGFQGLFRR